LCKENEDLKLRLQAATNTITELESQISQITNDVSKLQSLSNKLETEAAEYRHQRNLAVDERDEQVKMLLRRNAEIERLQTDLTTLTKQFEAAVNAKCEALAQADEVSSMKLRLEYREKRIEQERQLLNNQIESSVTSAVRSRKLTFWTTPYLSVLSFALGTTHSPGKNS
jgi:nucleoprotein TPR